MYIGTDLGTTACKTMMYDSEGKYPWHEYKSVTPCIYCPIELDRGNNENYHPTDL